MHTLAQTAATLSSGTIAGLIDDNRYHMIEAIQEDFVTYCEKMSGVEFDNWQHAWKVYAMQTRVNANHVCAWLFVGYSRKVSPWFPSRKSCKAYLNEHNIEWDFIGTNSN